MAAARRRAALSVVDTVEIRSRMGASCRDGTYPHVRDSAAYSGAVQATALGSKPVQSFTRQDADDSSGVSEVGNGPGTEL